MSAAAGLKTLEDMVAAVVVQTYDDCWSYWCDTTDSQNRNGSRELVYIHASGVYESVSKVLVEQGTERDLQGSNIAIESESVRLGAVGLRMAWCGCRQ